MDDDNVIFVDFFSRQRITQNPRGRMAYNTTLLEVAMAGRHEPETNLPSNRHVIHFPKGKRA